MNKYSIRDLRNFAKQRGGRCLTKSYLGINVKHLWKCKCGNKFLTTPSKIIHRMQWCPKCGIIKRSQSQALAISDCQKIASQRGGACLSKSYKNSSTHLLWKCSKGHKWNATFNSVKGSARRKGTWCPHCNAKKPHNLAYARSFGKSIGWKCLSIKYENYNSKLKWLCSEGHTFYLSLDKAFSRRSCPKCNIFWGEELCRFYFESIFAAKFPKEKPEFLKIKKGVYLELDGYNKSLGLAFEHNGIQHQRFISAFHTSIEAFESRKNFDIIKQKLCKDNNVVLINVLAIPEQLKPHELGRYLVSEFNKLGISYDIDKVPSHLNFTYNTKNSRIKLLTDIARSRGGSLISKNYVTGRTKLTWRCKKKHIWSSTPENIIGSKSKIGTWCPICANVNRNRNRTFVIKDMHTTANKFGGFCLSKIYKNSQTKLKWMCKHGHIFRAIPNSIRQGSWCPKCSGKNWTISDIKKWAMQHGGKCLSKTYVNIESKLRWACMNGHTWELSRLKMQKRINNKRNWCLECC